MPELRDNRQTILNFPYAISAYIIPFHKSLRPIGSVYKEKRYYIEMKTKYGYKV